MDEDQLEALTGIRVTMMLADYAAAADGKLTIVGGGWTYTGPGPTSFGIAMLLEIPWALANTPHQMQLDLLDIDGEPVLAEDGEAIMIAGEFEIGAPEDSQPGSQLTMPVALNNPGVFFPPASTLEWRLSIDGKSRPDWRLIFHTRSLDDDVE